MFTGIVTTVGAIKTVTPLGDAQAGVQLVIHAPLPDAEAIASGDSIAVQGACMTVVEQARVETEIQFTVDVSRETLTCTTGLDMPGEVNLELALRAYDRIHGHLVSGHIDGLGIVTHFTPMGESYLLRLNVPRTMSPYFACKGSVSVNGVSLTINAVNDHADGCECAINLIPYTLRETTLKYLRPGARVNLEIDLVARYVERLLRMK
jgi:riboflavin synthase